jgi:hypothetical protein
MTVRDVPFFAHRRRMRVWDNRCVVRSSSTVYWLHVSRRTHTLIDHTFSSTHSYPASNFSSISIVIVHIPSITTIPSYPQISSSHSQICCISYQHRSHIVIDLELHLQGGTFLSTIHFSSDRICIQHIPTFLFSLYTFHEPYSEQVSHSHLLPFHLPYILLDHTWPSAILIERNFSRIAPSYLCHATWYIHPFLPVSVTARCHYRVHSKPILEPRWNDVLSQCFRHPLLTSATTPAAGTLDCIPPEIEWLDRVTMLFNARTFITGMDDAWWDPKTAKAISASNHQSWKSLRRLERHRTNTRWCHPQCCSYSWTPSKERNTGNPRFSQT